jgi:LysM repeat protein
MKPQFFLNDMKRPQPDIEIELEEVEVEEEKPPIKFKSAFGVVLALHAIVIGGILISSNNQKATAEEIKEDKKFVSSNESVYVGEPEKQEEIKPEEAVKNDYPRPNDPMVKTMPKTNETKIAESVPTPTPQQQAKNTETKTKSKYTQTYQVKQGDTINSIAKKYRLVTERLMKINNIKDPNKIYVGQTLKFF